MEFPPLLRLVVCGVGAVNGVVLAAYAAVRTRGNATLNRLLALLLCVFVVRMAQPVWFLTFGATPAAVEAAWIVAFGATPAVFLVYAGMLTRNRGRVARRFVPALGLSAPFVVMAWLAVPAPISFRLFMSLVAVSVAALGVTVPIVVRFVRRARPSERAASRWALGTTAFIALVLALHVASVLAPFDARTVEALIVATGVFGLVFGELEWGLLARIHHARARDLYPEEDPVLARLTVLMEDERVFLNPQLTLASLARQLKVPTHSLSRMLSHRVGLSFRDFVDRHRVEEFQRRLSSDSAGGRDIEALAAACGFGSAETFHAAFRRATHLSPADYIERMRSRGPN